MLKEDCRAMRWGVKSSFVDYVRGAEGDVFVSAPAVGSEDVFTFRRRADDDERSIVFEGSVRFVAYGGMLDVRVSNPGIDFGGEAPMLSVESAPGVREQIARLHEVPADRGDTPDYEPRLTYAGVRLLGEVYEVNTVADRIRLLGR